ncbi:MAG: DUF1015 domain-containing protein [Candidatus Aminicenantaceae bacterium]
MAEIKSFKGLRYNTKKVNLSEVITEPYDRITPLMQEEYYNRNPYNVVRIILGKEDDLEHPEKDKYKRAGIYLNEWEKEEILIRDETEALYIYEQEFSVRNERKKRKGIIARVKLEEFSSKKVLPHEKTFPKHKIDRLNLLRATKANTGQIFLLYKDEEKKVFQAVQEALEKAEVVADTQDEDNNSHRVWKISDKYAIQKIQEAMADKVLIIADGHHRYETSLNYRNEMIEHIKEVKGDESFNFIMMTLFDLDDPGLVILPTYRLVKDLDKLTEDGLKQFFSTWFEISEINCPDPSDKSVIEIAQQKIERENYTFTAYISEFDKIYIFHLKSEDILDAEINGGKSREWKRLDVSILHSLIIDRLTEFSSGPFSLENNVSYIRNLEEGLKKVKDGEFQMIFLLRSPSLNQIKEIVESGEVMPHKSTDFFPKLKSGLIINPLEE